MAPAVGEASTMCLGTPEYAISFQELNSAKPHAQEPPAAAANSRLRSRCQESSVAACKTLWPKKGGLASWPWLSQARGMRDGA